MKRRVYAALAALSVLATSCGGAANTTTTETTVLTTSTEPSDTTTVQTTVEETDAETTAAPSANDGSTSPAVTTSDIIYLKRPTLLGDIVNVEPVTYSPRSGYLTPESDLSNVYLGGYEWEFGDSNEYYDTTEIRSKLIENGFVLSSSHGNEFFQTYETNRYNLQANFVTTDSVLHTYNIYFMHLLRDIESKHLCGDLTQLSKDMLAAAEQHYSELSGTEWEDAALKEMAFFAVGAKLQDSTVEVPAAVSDMVSKEIELINAASGIDMSYIFEELMEDYSQYKPRGNYETTEQLQRYFRAMTWYGKIGFRSDDQTLNRAALLITLSLADNLDSWSRIYQVTSFFAGESDDFGYYELMPIIEAVYGKGTKPADLVGKETEWSTYNDLCQTLDPPQISSVVVLETDSDEEKAAANKGFRFMGQRFTLDEAVFEQLVFRNVKKDDEGNARKLPSAMDFPAAMGSKTAEAILEEEGLTNYPNFSEQMDKAKKLVSDAPDSMWSANLYSSWIYTISPLLNEKDDSYPAFMRTDAWNRRNLISFLGSYAELKHATILYTKQIMAEMGGGGEPDYDDRGYVDCEPEVFARLSTLITSTSDGLAKFDMIEPDDKENMALLAQLCDKLKVIAVKELEGELPTDDEFELIRTMGGQLEHFWEAVMDKEYPDETYHDTMEHPPAYIADIATDPDGSCLEVGVARPFCMYTIVEVDGQLKIASGPVFSYYEFSQPIDDRLTDTEWRIMMGIQPDENGEWGKQTPASRPEWYDKYYYSRY